MFALTLRYLCSVANIVLHLHRRLTGIRAFTCVLLTFTLAAGASAQSKYWSAGVPLPRGIGGRPSVATVNGRIYVIGGNDGSNVVNTTFIYDLSTSRWTQGNPMPAARQNAAVAVINGKIHVIGGAAAAGTPHADHFVYDPATDRWDTRAPLPTAITQASAATVGNSIYFMGGTYGGGSEGFGANVISSNYEYVDDGSNVWIERASLPTARALLSMVVVGQKIYAIGGHGLGTTVFSSNEVYDTASRNWDTKTPMPTARNGMIAAALNGQISVIGGSPVSNPGFNSIVLSSNEEYDPLLNQWSSRPAMPTARVASGATVADNAIYVIGGINAGSALTTNEILNSTTVWGARIILTRLSTGETIRDNLVSVENGVLTLFSGLFIGEAGVIADPSAQIPLSDINAITILRDQYDPNNPDGGSTYNGFNKYIAVAPDAKAKTVQLADNPLQGSFWNYFINSFNSDDGLSVRHLSAGLTLTAIPRVHGANDPVTRKSNPLIDRATEVSLRNSAAFFSIPPQLLYAVAWKESLAGFHRYAGIGWNQFGYYSPSPSDANHDDPVGFEKTVITYDGGIGIMQITGGTVVSGRSGNALLTHIYKLASSIGYNSDSGAQVLSSFFTSGNSAPYLEHWFYAVGQYNGTGQRSADYRNGVWGIIRVPPYFSRDVQAIPDLSTPTVPAPPTKYPAHADANFDGQIDLVIGHDPNITIGHNQVSVSIQALGINGALVTDVKVRVRYRTTSTDQVTLVQIGQNIFAGKVAVQLLMGVPITIVFDVTLRQADGSTSVVTGATVMRKV
ncbi:MAG TPA: kelch repeat-containing protein [Fimbriimonadaceae bacterium]|nr:kelch repeat-containing protein [Fimbriimonadaceae bacterium]